MLYSYCSCLLASFKAFLSLVPRPPLFLPSVCVHNNTREWRTRFCWSSAPVYYCEPKWKVNMGQAGERGQAFPTPYCKQLKLGRRKGLGTRLAVLQSLGHSTFSFFFTSIQMSVPLVTGAVFFFSANNRLMILLWWFNRKGRIALGSDDVLIPATCSSVQHPLYSCSLYRIAGNIGDL